MQQKLKAKAIFLDLDGTIVDSTEAYLEAAEIAFQANGKNPPDSKILLEIPKRIEQHLTIEDITQCCNQKFLPTYLKAYYSVTEKKTKLLPNISKTLEFLSKKTTLALITMRYVPNPVIQKELDYLGISKYFKCILTALDTIRPKPSPEAITKAIQILDIDKHDCIIAGDSINDVRAGKAAGVKTVSVLSGLYRREELLKEKPDLILPDITILPEHIE